MTNRFGKRTLFGASEVDDANYGVDPSSDGSGYTNFPVWELGEVKDLKMQEETDQQEGTLHGSTPPEEGADGWEFSAKGPFCGNLTAAGDGSAPPADDWYDLLLAHIFAAAIVENGEGVGSGSTTSSLVLDAALGGLQSLHPIWESGIPTGGARTQWSMATSIGTAPTYPIAPTLTQAPTTAAVRQGTKTYLPSDNGGPSLAFHRLMDGRQHTLLGGRCTSFKLAKTAAKKSLIWEATFRGNEKIRQDKASLPAITVNPIPCLKALRSPIWFNNTAIPTSSIEFDLGINAEENESTAANNGRANIESMRLAPRVTISPIFSNQIEDWKRGVSLGPMLLQLGAGILTSGRLNAMALHFAQAHIATADEVNDKGYSRQGVTIVADKMGIFSGTTAARFMQLVRA